MKVVLVKEDIDLSLMCLGDDYFNVYLSENINPIVLENEEISIMLMPMRLNR